MKNSSEQILEDLGLPGFRPFFGLMSGHAQTMASFYWPQREDLDESVFHELSLPDGDRLILVEDRPSQWRTGHRIIVLIHGLCGCHQSHYMKRLARRFYQKGFLVLRVNLRNCGPGLGMSHSTYHSGRSEDAREVLRWLQHRYPVSPVTQMGFSLGANLTLKLLGESDSRGNLDSAVAVSPPIDLGGTVEKFSQISNQVYDKYFVARLKTDIRLIEEKQKKVQRTLFKKRMSLKDIDEIYTAPKGGFTDARDYYQKSSALQYMDKIVVPTLVLWAEDDPIIDTSAFARAPDNENLHYLKTQRGGHVGFIARPDQGMGKFWMDEALERWVQRLSE